MLTLRHKFLMIARHYIFALFRDRGWHYLLRLADYAETREPIITIA
jgi:hypothetical protein